MSKKILGNIKENYKNLEKTIVSQLNLEVDNHYLTAGYNREKIWFDFFRQVIPMKFAIKQGVFLIDSYGEVSKEVDIAVFDEQYTPYIFNYGSIHFIPIEAVAIVIQCKSRTVDNTNIEDWHESVSKLKTKEGGIARMASFIASSPVPTQKSTSPISILCCLENEGRSYENYDLVIKAMNEKDGLDVSWNSNLKTLEDCFLKYNGLDKEDNKKDTNLEKKLDDLKVTDNAILSLIFQLNQVLMLINNPMLFPHQAYVNMFNNSTEK